MRLFYFFTSIKPVPLHTEMAWSANNRATNYYATDGLVTEGFFWLWGELTRRKIIDQVNIVVDSARGTGFIPYTEHVHCYVVPKIDDTIPMIKPDDLIFARGGFKPWFPFLNRMHDEGNWLLFYRANTNRGRWTFWDIVFDDLAIAPYVEADRFHFPFMKPTHPDIFKPMKIERFYDICIGSSHIHDKKAQWKTVKAARYFNMKYKPSIVAVMPGGLFHGTHTNNIIQDIEDGDLNITLPGMLPRKEVPRVYNSSKLYIHLAPSGQNDRGVLEAMRCGTPVMMAHPQVHAPFTYEDENITYVTSNSDNPQKLADELHEAILASTEEKRERVREYYMDRSGEKEVIIPQMRRLFDFLRDHPRADRQAVWREFGV